MISGALSPNWAHVGHAALEQIQLSLGHASILTTERYLGVRQDLADAPCDHLGLSMPDLPQQRLVEAG